MSWQSFQSGSYFQLVLLAIHVICKKMGFSNASIFVSTFLIIMFLVVVVKKTRNTDQEVTIYNFSFDEGEDEEIDGELFRRNFNVKL